MHQVVPPAAKVSEVKKTTGVIAPLSTYIC